MFNLNDEESERLDEIIAGSNDHAEPTGHVARVIKHKYGGGKKFRNPMKHLTPKRKKRK